MPGWLKALLICFVVFLVVLIAKGKGATAAYIVTGIWDAAIGFAVNLGVFFKNLG